MTKMPSRVLITGIAGFIGSNLSRALLDRGYYVSGVDDCSVGEAKYVDPRVSHFKYDPISCYFEYAERRACCFDTIVHLASKKIPRHGGATQVLVENTMNMMCVLEIAKRTGAKVIFASTSDVYGKQTEFHEGADSILGPSDISRWTYALTKLWCEQLLYAQTDVDFNIIRYFGSYGPYMSLTWTAGPPSVFISQALKGEPLTVHGDGKQTRCFSYVDDIVDGTIRLMESGLNREVFNLGNTDEEISMTDFAIKVSKLINPGGCSDILLSPYTNIKYEDVMRRVPDISKAQALLGYQPQIDLNEGLRRTIQWQRKEIGL